MTDYVFENVLTYDSNPGGVVRLLRNGSVDVLEWPSQDLIETVVSDAGGRTTVTTTDIGVIQLRSPNGFLSEPIVAPELLVTAAALGVSEDAAVAALVADTGSDTRAATDVVYTKKGAQVVWLEDQAGVATNGTTECGTAIQSAITAAESADVMLVSKPGRVYVSASTLTFKKSCDLWGSTISYSGTGTAVVLGDDVNGVTRQHFRIGRVVSSGFTTGWGAGTASIGVKIVDANKSRADIKSVTQFLTGVQMLGHARGNAYNEVHVSELATNKVNMQQTADSGSGFCNQNQVIGGSWNHDSTLAGGTGVAGTKHVLQDSSGGGPVPDTNLFFGCAFEGNVVERMVDSAGKMNTFRDCRWEATTPVVVWQSGSYGNVIRDGYKPELISITNSGDYTNVATWPASGDVTEIVIGPEQMQTVNGTATRGAVVRHPVYNVAASASDVLGFTARLPANWHTYDVDLHIVHDVAAGSGTTQWLWRPSFNGDGDTIAQPAGGTSRSITVNGQKVKKLQTIETGLTATAGKQLTANLVISGGTFANTVGVLAVVLRRRS